MTCKKLFILMVVSLLGCVAHAETCTYVNGYNIFEVSEVGNKYKVVCRRENSNISSRNRNILDRQFRIIAVDLIGAYILYNREHSHSFDNFQNFVEEINLHYNAVVEGLKLEQITLNGKSCIVYYCDKNKYNIESATYDTEVLSTCINH